MSASADTSNFQMSTNFLFLCEEGGGSLKPGRTLNFSAVKRGVHVDWGAPPNNYGICNMIEVIYYINRATG